MIMKDSGFTLLEILTAITVGAALLLTCGVIMRMGSDDQQIVSQTLSWERQASRVYDHFNRDLATAHRRGWYQAQHQDPSQVGWFVLRSKQSQDPQKAISDLCAVSYTLRDLNDGSGRVIRSLMRIQHDSATVLSAMESNEEDGLWRMNEANEPLVGGVLSFDLWPLLEDGFGEWLPWHSELKSMPEAVELRLVMASPSLQERLRTTADWDEAMHNLSQLDPEDVLELKTLIYLGLDAD